MVLHKQPNFEVLSWEIFSIPQIYIHQVHHLRP